MAHSSKRLFAVHGYLCISAFLAGSIFFSITAKAQDTITTVAGGGTNSSLATRAVVLQPSAVTVDSLGNLFVTSRSLSQVFKVDNAGNLTVVAGTGTSAYSGDGGPATNANLNLPEGIAVDRSGNVYIADTYNNVVRRVDSATGVITTAAGIRTGGFSGDNGPATSAELYFPVGLAVDNSGNLFIADSRNQRVRLVDAATGIISTVAGTGSAGYGGDGGPAISAMIDYPMGVAFDGSGNLVIADTGNQRIRRVDAATGIISTVAGNGSPGFGGDSGLATAAMLSGPIGITFDSSGNLYIADSNNMRVRRVAAATGIISTVAGNGTYAYSGDGGPATSAELEPWCVAADGSGNLFIADYAGQRVRRVDAISQTITTAAGGGSDGDGAAATGAFSTGLMALPRMAPATSSSRTLGPNASGELTHQVGLSVPLPETVE